LVIEATRERKYVRPELMKLQKLDETRHVEA
jgi:hypothetical protein